MSKRQSLFPQTTLSLREVTSITLSSPSACGLHIGFMSLGSGSSGNCYYFSTPQGSLLIDAGVPLRRLKQGMQVLGKDFDQIDAIVVTHGHCDHTRNVERLSCLYDIPVYASKNVFLLLDTLKSRYHIRSQKRHPIVADSPFSIVGFEVTPFSIPHDFPETLGYTLSYGDFHLALFSDVGHYEPHHYAIARMANHLILESNFDREMLQKGNYPLTLKQRVAGEFGHTGNEEAATFLNQVCHKELQRVWLAHLSQENNTPERCLRTFYQKLEEKGGDFLERIKVLPRYDHTPLYLWNLKDTENQAF